MRIRQQIEESINIKAKILDNKELLSGIGNAAQKIIEAFTKKHAVYFCGNGGSASDAQHLSAELSGRFNYDRPPLKSEALHVNTSYLTAVANDYGYNKVFSRMIEAVGNEGDILVGLSTSGNSENIIEAFKYAQANNIFTIGLTGQTGGVLKTHSDILIAVPSNNTARIQEAHILIGHIICEITENTLFPKP